MRVLWFTWKDIKNPLAGGAETVAHNLAKRLVKKGHKVTFLTAGFKNSSPEEKIEGYKIIRVGGRFSVYLKASRYYKKNLAGQFDLVIEEVNTIPFFTQCFVKEKKRFLFFHQLCREIWFFQMFFPFSLIGYLFEPIYLWFMRKNKVITISKSTKSDLLKYGFDPQNIEIISEGIELKPLEKYSAAAKFGQKTMLSIGSIRDMKRPIDQLRAFEIAKSAIPSLKLKIAGGGSGPYFDSFITQVKKSPFANDIEYLGRVSEEEKIGLMQKCHFVTVTSVKEGWGLIVTEANSQGTPALVYDIDGLRDSVKNGVTGYTTDKNSALGLSKMIIKLCKLSDADYRELCERALLDSRRYTFDISVEQFLEICTGGKNA